MNDPALSADRVDDVFDWAASPDLPRFLRGVTTLNQAERQQIISGAKAVLAGYYVHLPDKQATPGVDPIAALDRLNQALPPDDDDVGFHAAMCDIFAALCDLHTHYTLPEPYRSGSCLLPFKLADYGSHGARRVLVTEVQSSYRVPPDQAGFGIGAEILSWNGLPIETVLMQEAQRSGGANIDARRARALASLTIRSMQRLPPPDRAVVLVGYRPAEHAPERSTIFPWRVITVDAETGHDSIRAFVGLDHEGELRRRASARAYYPNVARNAPAAGARARQAPSHGALPTRFPTVFKAHGLSGNEFGYIRIFSFAPPVMQRTLPDLINEFVDEFVYLLRCLPPGGLVLDVRGNNGGFLPLAESLFQTLTSVEIKPQPVELRATPQVLALCLTKADLAGHLPLVEQALASGATYSDGRPITEHEWCNGRPRACSGPVILIVDARCYSATDAFAAGFQDHAIGQVLGISAATGAGGANVWELHDLLDAPGFPLSAWPMNAGLKLALRRTRRVGLHEGELLEGVGVTPDVRHVTTRADLLNGDRDLLACAVALLRGDGGRQAAHPTTAGPVT